MSLVTVKRNAKYLEDLSNSDLTASKIAEKRGELYLEALDALSEAKSMFQKNKDEKGQIASSWFLRILDTLKFMAQLYGLDNVKIDSFTQVNQQFNTYTPEKIDAVAGRKIADMLKKKHEEKLKLGHG